MLGADIRSYPTRPLRYHQTSAERARASTMRKKALEDGWLHSSSLVEALKVACRLVIRDITHVEPPSFAISSRANRFSSD